MNYYGYWKYCSQIGATSLEGISSLVQGDFIYVYQLKGGLAHYIDEKGREGKIHKTFIRNEYLERPSHKKHLKNPKSCGAWSIVGTKIGGQKRVKGCSKCRLALFKKVLMELALTE
jgi:predicted sulfurtransferase